MSSIGITLNTAGSLSPVTTLTHEVIAGLEDKLFEIQQRISATDLETLRSGHVPQDQRPLDAAFYTLPAALLSEYEQTADESQLGRILTEAERIQNSFDAVVVLGIGGSYMGARALLESLKSPYYNESDRTVRRGCPRLYFAGNNLDNDALADLLDHLEASGQKWCTIVISKSGGTLETATALRVVIEHMQNSNDGIQGRIVPVTGDDGKLKELSEQLGCSVRFNVPNAVGGRFSVLSAVGLLPAAVIGLDVLELLRGATDMNRCFEDSSVTENPVLRFIAVTSLLEQLLGCTIRVTSVWSDALESIGLWYDQLLAESLGKQELGATPITAVNTRDLHSRSQQHQEGRRDKLIVNLAVRKSRRKDISVPKSEYDQDELNQLSGVTYHEMLNAALSGTNMALREANRPTLDIFMTSLDERHVGQLLQFFMLATVAEGRLLGINPYGQPGVEAYKRNMKSILDIKD